MNSLSFLARGQKSASIRRSRLIVASTDAEAVKDLELHTEFKITAEV